jgi:hypothetical protein
MSRPRPTPVDLVGIKTGGNPHRWYSPADVHKVIERITADYKKIDPADGAYFEQQKSIFETTTLAPYDHLIKAKYAGTPIGASESIVSPLADERTRAEDAHAGGSRAAFDDGHRLEPPDPPRRRPGRGFPAGVHGGRGEPVRGDPRGTRTCAPPGSGPTAASGCRT